MRPVAGKRKRLRKKKVVRFASVFEDNEFVAQGSRFGAEQSALVWAYASIRHHVGTAVATSKSTVVARQSVKQGCRFLVDEVPEVIRAGESGVDVQDLRAKRILIIGSRRGPHFMWAIPVTCGDFRTLKDRSVRERAASR